MNGFMGGLGQAMGQGDMSQADYQRYMQQMYGGMQQHYSKQPPSPPPEPDKTLLLLEQDINFGVIIDKQDKYALIERKKKQYQKVIKQAKAEIEHEKFRAAVEAEKLKIRSKRSSWWSKLFPFVIKIERSKNV